MNKRLTFYVPALDPTNPGYCESDSDSLDPAQARFIDYTDKANAVSSWIDEDGFGGQQRRHMPCLDVDVVLNVGQRLVRDLMFPDVRVVESSTPGHTHWYSDTPITWGEYQEKLNTLVDCDIVEAGYASASIERGATFLRLPHIKKRSAT